MESVILKALWFLIHLVVDLIEIIFDFCLELRENSNNFIKNIRFKTISRSKEDEIAFIEAKISEIKKLPSHIVVILNINNERDVDLSKVANLVFWSLNIGVNFISFYDYKGILKHQLASSFHKIIKEQTNASSNENIVWGPDFYNSSSSEGIRFPHRNGYKRHIVINLYSSHDSYGMFNQLLKKEFCDEKEKLDDESSKMLSSQEITIECVEKKLSKLYGNMPDPELGIYFGKTTCTAGLLPWHIRLTEFIQISSKIHHLSLEKFIRVLCMYAKCEQRFGK